MLRVEVPEQVRVMTEEWVASKPDFRVSALDRAHMTVVFVGRDLKADTHDAIMEVTRSALYLVPETIMFQGRFAMFGGRRDHLVGLVIPDDRLSFLRKALCDRLRDSGIGAAPSWGYTPHVTLAKGLPGDGCMSTTIERSLLPITEISVKLGPLYISMHPQKMEQRA